MNERSCRCFPLGKVVEAETRRPTVRSHGEFTIVVEFLILGRRSSPARPYDFRGVGCIDVGKILTTSPIYPACETLDDCGCDSEGAFHRAPRIYICTDWYDIDRAPTVSTNICIDEYGNVYRRN